MPRPHAPGSVYTLTRAGLGASPLAAHCGGAFSPRRRRRDARFCKPTCRAKWHTAQRAAVLVELEDAIARAAVLVRELREGRDR